MPEYQPVVSGGCPGPTTGLLQGQLLERESRKFHFKQALRRLKKNQQNPKTSNGMREGHWVGPWETWGPPSASLSKGVPAGVKGRPPGGNLLIQCLKEPTSNMIWAAGVQILSKWYQAHFQGLNQLLSMVCAGFFLDLLQAQGHTGQDTPGREEEASSLQTSMGTCACPHRGLCWLNQVYLKVSI